MRNTGVVDMMNLGEISKIGSKGLLFGLMLLCIHFRALSQADREYFFETINSNDGLSSDIVTDIHQDHEGFLWIATQNGLNRYDGYSFKTFKPDYNKEVTFTSNHFTAIAEDNQGRLWLGTSKNGINIYNKYTGEVSVISTTSGDLKMPDDAISALHIDQEGNKWIGTANYGILRLDRANRLTIYRIQKNHLSGVRRLRVIFEDSNNRIWIGTWDHGLFYYDRQQDDFIHVSLPWPHPVAHKNIQSIEEDSSGRLLIGTWGHGLFRLDSITQKTRDIEYCSYLDKDLAEQLNDNEVGNLIYSIEKDKNGQIWLGTNYGILIFDGENIRNPRKIKANQRTQYAPDHSQIYSLLSDREGIMWLGTHGGGLHKVNLDRNIFTLNEIPFSTSKLIRESSVYSFCELDRENLLVGVKTEGFLQYNKSTHTYNSYTDIDVFKELPRINLVYDFHTDQFGRMWMGTRYRGAFLFDLKSGSYINLNDTYPDFNCWSVYCFTRDVDQNIWIGTNNGLYVFKYFENNEKQYRVFHFNHFVNDPHSLSGNDITAIYQDSQGDVWLGTMNSGLNRYTGIFVKDEMSFQRYKAHPHDNKSISSNIINDIYEDSRGNLWIGSDGGGLMKYNRDQDNFRSYGKKEGLIANSVASIIESADSSLWMGTNEGVVRKTYQQNGDHHFTNYTINDGLQGRIFIRGAKHISAYDRTYYFGGHNGFNSFKPGRVDFTSIQPQIAITELRFNSKIKNIDAGSEESIEVPHHVKTLSIEFSSLSFKNPDQNQYAYILDGYNSDWQYVEASDRKAVFTNLPRGHYTFKVKASNSNGLWCEEPVTLNFAIRPSPYASTLALIIYGLIILGVFSMITRIAVYRTKMKQELKFVEELRDKEEKQHQFKLRTLTNISHEFLTPLSIISCVVEDARELKNFPGQSVRIIQRNVSMLKNLVNQFMRIRQSEAANAQLNVTSNNLKDHLTTIYQTFYPLAGKKGLQYDMFLSNDLKDGYYDRDKLEKIMHNLLSNAFKYTEKGGVSIYGQNMYKDSKRYVQISVNDTGQGIPEDKLNKIFKRFKRIESNKAEGIGIGLELTKSLVELHKGTITVKSHIHSGTSFVFEFPIESSAYPDEEFQIIQDTGDLSVTATDQPVAVQNHHKFIFDQEIPFDGGKWNDKKVLLIEDNEELKNLLYNKLSKYYGVTALDNCDKALYYVKKNHPDLIVSDIMMPGTGGYEFTRKIKNNLETSHIPVILLTARIDDESKIKGYDCGADSYVTKPVNLKLLHSRIESLFKAWENLQKYYSGNFSEFKPDSSTVNLTSLDEKYIKRSIEIIESHMTDNDFNVESLVHEMGTSNSMLYRKFNKIIGISPNEYIKNNRLKVAARMLYDENLSISEVAYSTGFNDLSYFGKCFKKYYGKSPTEYRSS